jgi:GTP-binding protein EngB required for normal cell division
MIKHDDIKAFMQGLYEESERQSTMKLVVLGKGQIGKSTLINFLQYCNICFLKITQYSKHPNNLHFTVNFHKE